MSSDIQKLHPLAADAEVLKHKLLGGAITQEVFMERARKLKETMDEILVDEETEVIKEYMSIINSVLVILELK